jgi:hypothetical protein
MNYEAVDWHDSTTMARTLLRRHRDLSTVRAMVRNQFGRAPSIDALARMRDAAPRTTRHLAWHEDRPIRPGTEAHETAMEQGSRDLLAALWQKHQRVMLVAKALGRQVVIP